MTDELIVADAATWRAWLGEHHESLAGVWLVLAKKGTTQPTSLSLSLIHISEPTRPY